MKRALAASDSTLDYMFLATAGVYGGAANFDKLALVVGGTTLVSSLGIPDTNWHHISVALDPGRLDAHPGFHQPAPGYERDPARPPARARRGALLQTRSAPADARSVVTLV